MKNKFSAENTAAAIRLKRTKKQQAGDDEQKVRALAAEREDANERLFRQIEENKKGAVPYEEYLKIKKLKD